MKKAKLIALLSVSMILAACGGKRTTPETPSSSIEESSSLETPSSSSEVIENEPTYEESIKTFAEGYNAILEGARALDPNNFSFTETQEINFKESSEQTVGVPGQEPVMVQGKEATMTQMDTIAYDAKNKVGYYLSEYVNGNEKEFSDAFWTAKKDGKYYSYDSDWQGFNEVDEDFFWHVYADDSLRFGMDSQKDPEAIIANLSEIKGELEYTYKHIASSLGDECVGDVKFETKFTSTNEKKGKGGVLSLKFTVTATYDSSKLDLEAIGANPYLLSFESSMSEVLIFTYEDKGIESAVGSMEMAMETAISTDGVVQSDKQRMGQEVKATSKLEYTPFPYEIDTSTYADNGKTSSSLWVCIPNKGETEIARDSAAMGDKYEIKDTDILSSDAIAAGITYELYADKAFTKKLDQSNMVAKSYSETVYIKYNIPSTVTYALYECRGVFASDIESREYSWNASSDGEYVGPAKNGFFAPAYAKNNVHDYNTGILYTTAMFATTEAVITYSTDKTATVKNNKMVDLKAGEFYYIVFTCDQVI